MKESRESKTKSTQSGRTPARAHAHTHTSHARTRRHYFGTPLCSALLGSYFLPSRSFARRFARTLRALSRPPGVPKDGPSSRSATNLPVRCGTHQQDSTTRATRNMKTPMENQLSWLALFMTALYSREYIYSSGLVYSPPSPHLLYSTRYVRRASTTPARRGATGRDADADAAFSLL